MERISVRLDIVHRSADGGGAVEHDGGLDALRHDGFEKGKLGADAVDWSG